MSKQLILVSLLGSLLLPGLWAQALPKPGIPACGKTKHSLANPQYLRTSEGTVVVELPSGWSLDKTHRLPFYFLKANETYANARTLMYINVQELNWPLQEAVSKDRNDFESICHPLVVKEFSKPALLEEGCEAKMQMFSCHKQKASYVDLATKIAIDGLLLNVVLSADNAAEISRYRKDYDYVLKHLTLVR